MRPPQPLGNCAEFGYIDLPALGSSGQAERSGEPNAAIRDSPTRGAPPTTSQPKRLANTRRNPNLRDSSTHDAPPTTSQYKRLVSRRAAEDRNIRDPSADAPPTIAIYETRQHARRRRSQYKRFAHRRTADDRNTRDPSSRAKDGPWEIFAIAPRYVS